MGERSDRLIKWTDAATRIYRIRSLAFISLPEMSEKLTLNILQSKLIAGKRISELNLIMLNLYLQWRVINPACFTTKSKHFWLHAFDLYLSNA